MILVVSMTSSPPFVAPHRVAHRARGDVGRRSAAVETDRAANRPLAVEQLHAVGVLLYLQLMRREDLACEGPRHALEKAGIVSRVASQRGHGGRREPGSQVAVELITRGVGVQLHEGPRVVGRVVEQLGEPFEAGVGAPKQTEDVLEPRGIAPHAGQVRRVLRERRRRKSEEGRSKESMRHDAG